jgi:hypothetical protein
MKAHNTIIDAKMHQTEHANRARQKSGLAVEDLVYLSTKNLKLPKNHVRKLALRYLGPFCISQVTSPGALYKLELSQELRPRVFLKFFMCLCFMSIFPMTIADFLGDRCIRYLGLDETQRMGS